MKFKAYRTHVPVGLYGLFYDDVIEMKWTHGNNFIRGFSSPHCGWKALVFQARVLKNDLKKHVESLK